MSAAGERARALRAAMAAGSAAGALEVLLWSSPKLGLGEAEIGRWLVIAMALGALFAALVALVARRLDRLTVSGPLFALLALHAAIGWRMHLVNAYAREPRVWAPMLGALLLGVALAALLDRPLRRRVAVLEALSAIVAFIAGLAAFQRASPPPAPPPGDQNNLVLITMDTARADRFSAYGADNPTPAFDAIAAGGALFQTAIATAPLTQPSHLAILTGDPPTVTGVVTNGTELGPRPALLPEALRARGWTTAAFVAGFPLHSRFGWAAPFDVYDDDFGALAGLHRLALVRLWDLFTSRGNTLRERRGDQVMARALPWLEANADRAFFLWVHLFDAHGPYEAPGHAFDPPTEGAALELPFYWPPRHRAVTSEDWLIDAYEAEIRFVDAQVGLLLGRLEALGLLERTVVIATADHGESLTEHGYLFDHGDDLFDPSLKVPLAIRAPGLPAGLRVPCQVSNEDVTPTALALLGVDDGIRRSGRDRGPELRGEPCREAPVFASTVGARFVDAPPVDHALRAGTHKLIRKAPRDGGAEAEYALYDLVADPGELAPLPAGAAPSADLRTVLDAALRGGAEAARPEADPATQEALRALGYIE